MAWPSCVARVVGQGPAAEGGSAPWGQQVGGIQRWPELCHTLDRGKTVVSDTIPEQAGCSHGCPGEMRSFTPGD